MRNPVQQERNSNQFKKEISLPARVNVVNIVREVVSSRPVVHHGGTTSVVHHGGTTLYLSFPSPPSELAFG